MTKKISVILPVYNGEKFISESIKSILSQDYNNFELIILNDGSTDSTSKIIEQYLNDARVKIFTYDRKGLIYILNEGLKIATGDFIARMDADDLSLPNRLSVQVAYFEKDIDLGILGTGTYICDEQCRFLQYGIYPFQESGINELMIEGNFICHPSAMFKRSLVDLYGGYSQHFLHAEDYELWMRYSKHTKLNNTQERLLLYRQHSENISFNKFPHQSMTAEIISYLYKGGYDFNCENGKHVNFEFLRSISDDSEFQKILNRWQTGVKGMIASGRIKKNQIEPYFLKYLDDNK